MAGEGYLIAIVVVVCLVLIVMCSQCKALSEPFTRIIQGVACGNAAPLGETIPGACILPDYTNTYFDGVAEESCELCPSPVICPDCDTPSSTVRGKLFAAQSLASPRASE